MAGLHKLTELVVRQAKPKVKPYKLTDGGGLYLEVMPNGSKYWRMKYHFAHKEKRLAFGVYPHVALTDAREQNRLAKAMLRDGNDPGLARKQEKLDKRISHSNSFAAIAAEWFEKRKAEGAAKVTLEKLDWILDKKLNPFIGDIPVAELKAPMLLQALKKIEAEGKHETASRANRVASQVLRYAVAIGKAERDCTIDLRGALVSVKAKHRAAITDPAELGRLLVAIDEFDGSPVVKAALKLTPMLFQRPGELRSLEWKEIDWEQERWEIPASKMKMRNPHIVPLSRQAIEILRDIHKETGHGIYVFPSAKGSSRCLSENGVRTALRVMGFGNDEVTPHGFRATARTILDEVLECRVDLIEHQLAHAVKDPTGRAYNRTSHLPARKEMMQRWADYLDELKIAPSFSIVHQAKYAESVDAPAPSSTKYNASLVEENSSSEGKNKNEEVEKPIDLKSQNFDTDNFPLASRAGKFFERRKLEFENEKNQREVDKKIRESKRTNDVPPISVKTTVSETPLADSINKFMKEQAKEFDQHQIETKAKNTLTGSSPVPNVENTK